jgi:hypothetical protein
MAARTRIATTETPVAAPTLPRRDRDSHCAETFACIASIAVGLGAEETTAGRGVPGWAAGAIAGLVPRSSPHLLHHAASEATIAPHLGHDDCMTVFPTLPLPCPDASGSMRPAATPDANTIPAGVVARLHGKGVRPAPYWDRC